MVHKKSEKNNNATLTGIIGAVIGAGFAVGATRILSNKITRDKLMNAIFGVKKQVMGLIDMRENWLGETKEEIKEKIEAGKNRVKLVS